jgi:hypothetical protein
MLFAEDADNPFIPFIDPVTSNEIVSNEDQFFPTNPHPFRTGTIIEGNGFLFKEREMDGLIFYDSLQVLDDPNKTLDIIKESDQYWTTCPGSMPLNSNLADFASSIDGLMDSGCTPGKIGLVDTTSDTDYLNDLLIFRSTEHEYWNNWLLDGTTHRLLTGFRLLPQYWGREKGSFFTGVYLPQKLVLSPPLERQYISD